MTLVMKSVFVDLKTYCKAKAKAEKEGTTISKVIRQGLTSYVEGENARIPRTHYNPLPKLIQRP